MIRQVIIPGRRFNRQDFRGEGRGHGSGRRVKRASKRRPRIELYLLDCGLAEEELALLRDILLE